MGTLSKEALEAAQRLRGQAWLGCDAILKEETRDLAFVEDLCRRSLAQDEAVFGPGSVEIVSALVNLGVLLDANGLHDEAAAVFDRMTAIIERHREARDESR